MANPYFNATYYLTNNPDVFAAGINTVEGAWEHYVNHGAAESLAGATSRKPAPWFDASYYLTNNPDLSTAGLTAGQLFEHFTVHGIGEGRAPSAEAVLTEDSLLKYALANEDLLEAFDIADDATELTDAQALALASQFYSHGYMESRPDAPFDASVDPVGATFALTPTADIADTTGYSINGAPYVTSGFKFTSANEVINATNATLATGDILLDASTTDRDVMNLTLTGALAAPAPTLTNIEVLNIQADLTASVATTLDFANVSAMKTVNVSGTSVNTNTITLNNAGGALTAANGITTVDASGLTGAKAAVSVSFAGLATAVTVKGSAGDDVITGSNGDSTLDGGAGNNNITGGAGADTITAGDGANVINAGNGANKITVGSGNNTINSGTGADVIETGNGSNTINAGNGNNTVTTGSGVDNITTGTGNDTISSGGGADFISSGAGVDVITTGAGADTVLFDQLLSANRNTVTDFTIGAGGDMVQLIAANTTLATAAGTAPVVTDDTTVAGVGGGAYGLTGATTANADVIVLQGGASLTGGVNGGDLSLTTADGLNGTELLKALTDGTAADAYTGITTAAVSQQVYFLAYQGGNGYLYHGSDADASGAIEASEIQLIGTLNGTGADGLVAANYAVLA